MAKILSKIKNTMKKRYVSLALIVATIVSCLTIPKCALTARMVRYNFADIDDYQIFDNRPLLHADTVFHFAKSDRKFVFPDGIFDKNAAATIDEFIEKNNTVAFLVIKNDTILYEKYSNGYNETNLVPSFSTAKSFTSALIGFAIQDGFIKSVTEPVTNYLPEMKANGWDKVQIEDVLNMASGMAFNESYINPLGEAAEFYYGNDLQNATKNLKLCREPATEFEYVSGNTELLGLILEKVLRSTKYKNVTGYLQAKIWSPLGMEYDASWSTDRPDGMEKTFCCLNATARDFAKFGRLYLNKGKWNGTQLLPAAWVTESTTPTTERGAWNGYRHQFWLPSQNGDFSTIGILGQYIYVNPANKVIIVRLGSKKGSVDNWAKWFSTWSAKI
jgi:CubicO group peptidase (beta-lactamase class C family)